MTKEVKKLMCEMRQIKAAMTRFGTYLKAIQTDNIDTNQLQIRKNKFIETYNQFLSVQTELDSLDAPESSDDWDEFETTYFNLLSSADQILSTNKPAISEDISHNNSSNRSILEEQACIKVRLPKINLPTFTGSYEEWYNFYDTFNSLIHSNNSIQPIEKFHYLKSSLKSDAAEILHSLELTASNYECAWELLRERYDNKRIIVQKHIKAVCELPQVTKENYSGIRHILDGILKHVRALKSLKCPTDSWDDILIYLITNKLDTTTNKAWETSLSRNDMPTLKQLTDFLAHRCQILDVTSRTDKLQISSNNKIHNKQFSVSHVTASKATCAFCSKDHLIYNCDLFLNLPIEKRIQETKSHKLCINCLRSNHLSNQCKSSLCKKCGKRHNTLLHLNSHSPTMITPSSSNSTTIANHSYPANNQNQILLSTAMVNIFDKNEELHQCRALLDSGSQSCFITERLVEKLGLNKIPVQIPVSGINQSTAHVNHIVQVKIKSRYNAYQANLDCLVLKKITENLPIISFNKNNVNIPKNIKLADPEFNITSNIDILIGVEIFYHLLCVGQIKTSTTQPCFQKTHFGWILSGSVAPSKKYVNATQCSLSINKNSLESQLTKFWHIEEYSPKAIYTQEEEICENIFKNTFRRNAEGRFIVQLPLKQNILRKIGYSRDQALKRFYTLENKLNKQPELMKQYSEFINEYQLLGHMKESDENNSTINDDQPCFYLPHHAVIKQTSLTTKLRVVFDGSAKSTSGFSINDALMVGPVLQQDLFSIVLRFRTHRYVLTADIAKMYRQVLVDESHTRLQRILWRNNVNEAVKSYDLLTVTYGTASASFLAIRAMHQLAEDERDNYPLGSAITIRDFYVDDLLTGANTIAKAALIRDEVNAMLKKGGFELRKWVSNSPELTSNFDFNTTEHITINLDNNESLKTLGLQWNSHNDVLQYSILTHITTSRITKRTILSSISQIFDPLGLIGPVVILAKILMQRLWQLHIAWDESVPTDIHSTWFQYRSQLQILNALRIPRWLSNANELTHVEIHGFCDASEQAYGACIYFRTTGRHGYSSNLICSKSRVAPLKNISLPKLELCGALLLARLMKKTLESFDITVDKVYYWTDSTITLSWIKATARTWKTFVANRVSEIQRVTDIAHWHHVGTLDNPADIISRGQIPQQLMDCKLWWHGPSWLIKDINDWPTSITNSCSEQEIPERRILVTTTAITGIDIDLLSRYSCINKLIRIVSYCLRFKCNLIQKIKGISELSNFGPLTTYELELATVHIIKVLQAATFQQDLRNLTKQGKVHSKSKLLCLNPFLDETGIIRVGGRLQYSKLPYDQKHQILLPKNHYITKLIIKREHLKQFHAGNQATLAAVRTRFWPLGARSIVRQVIKQCMVCFKAKPIPFQPIMGDIPGSRLEPARPFSNCGVDYFGPVYIRDGIRRNAKTIKAYGVIFICFATKAVHLELVRDLTTDAFINTLKRFMARRGKPHNIYSDNATNFVGSNKELHELRDVFLKDENTNYIIAKLADDNINWHFIPPRSPHFGGIWEAAVKSTKHHLRRIVGTASLSYEEMYTFLVQIEAILNSRPLTPLSSDPNDLSPLTPAHFLTGGSLHSVVDPDLTNVARNRLSRWQLLEQLRQHFWRRWTKEYLHQLQERSKWKSHASSSLQPGQLVIIREDNLPPLRWLLGRIEDVHPGKDGVIRTATIRTTAGKMKRSSMNLCPLPID